MQSIIVTKKWGMFLLVFFILACVQGLYLDICLKATGRRSCRLRWKSWMPCTLSLCQLSQSSSAWATSIPHGEKNYDFNWSLPWQCDLVGHEPSICTAESALGGRLTSGLPLAFTSHFWFNVHVSADRKKQRLKRTVHLSCSVYSTGWESKAVDWKKKKKRPCS